jgi:hypothetical protein
LSFCYHRTNVLSPIIAALSRLGIPDRAVPGLKLHVRFKAWSDVQVRRRSLPIACGTVPSVLIDPTDALLGLIHVKSRHGGLANGARGTQSIGVDGTIVTGGEPEGVGRDVIELLIVEGVFLEGEVRVPRPR